MMPLIADDTITLQTSTFIPQKHLVHTTFVFIFLIEHCWFQFFREFMWFFIRLNHVRGW